jgi:hypothetical protein
VANIIRQKLNAHSAKGQSFIEANTKDLYGIYLEARYRIESRIAEYVRSGRNSFTGPRMVKLMEEIQSMFPEFEEKYRETAKEAITYIAQSYYRSALNDLSLTGTPVDGFAKDRLQLTLDDAYTHIAGATRKMSDYAIYNLRRLSAQVMRVANLTGATRAQVSRQLYAANYADGFFQFRDRAGKAWNSEAYFDMLGRTLLHNTARENYLQACADEKSDIVTVSTSGNPCPACAKWERRLLSISGKSKKYPPLQDAINDGLFHPNCTHRLMAVPEVVADEDYDDKGRPLEGFNSEGNEVGDSKDNWKEYRKTQTGKPKKADSAKKLPKPPKMPDGEYDATRDQFHVEAVKHGNKEIAGVLADCYTPEVARYGPPPAIKFENGIKANYDSGTGILRLDSNPESWFGNASSARHEFGHYLDDRTRAKDPVLFERFQQAAASDWEGIRPLLKENPDAFKFIPDSVNGKSREYFGREFKDLSMDERLQITGYFDTIGSITNGKYGAGHDPEYYRMNLQNTEAWANIYNAVAGELPMRKDFPQMCKVIEALLKGKL